MNIFECSFLHSEKFFLWISHILYPMIRIQHFWLPFLIMAFMHVYNSSWDLFVLRPPNHFLCFVKMLGKVSNGRICFDLFKFIIKSHRFILFETWSSIIHNFFIKLFFVDLKFIFVFAFETHLKLFVCLANKIGQIINIFTLNNILIKFWVCSNWSFKSFETFFFFNSIIIP